jgi:hypothetical protein
MGNSSGYNQVLIFDDDFTKEEILEKCIAFSKMTEESHKGRSVVREIHFFDDDFYPCYEDAAKAISDIDKDTPYACFAVKYREGESEYPKRILAIENRKDRALEKYSALREKSYFENCKHQFITCKVCGSKLNVKELLKEKFPRSSNHCPLCDTDLRPESVTEREQKLKTQWEMLEEQERQAKEEFKRHDKKGRIKWLVKIEFR